jgi:hypothetical protein
MAYPKIGNRPIAEITTREVLAVLRSVEATGRFESAWRPRSVLGRVFHHAVATTRAERDPTGYPRDAPTVGRQTQGRGKLARNGASRSVG